MKVAIFHHAYGRVGGAEIQTLYHSIGFLHHNHETKVFWSGYINNVVKKLVNKYDIDLELVKVDNITKVINSLEDFDAILLDHHMNPVLMYFIVKKYKEKTTWYCGDVFGPIYNDVISSEDSWDYYKEQFKKLVKVPLLGNRLVFNILKKMYKLIDQRTVKKIPRIIANSNKVANQIYKVYKRKAYVVYPGVLIDEFSMRNKRIIEDRYILYVGALTEKKNIMRMVTAFQELNLKDVKFVIVGTGPLYNKINGKNIILYGSSTQEELSSLYEYCDFVVYATISEAFGTVPIEASIFKKPSIISENSGLSEVFRNMMESVNVNPYSIDDIKNAIRILLENKELRNELGRNAQRKTLEELNIYEVCDKILRYMG